MHQPRKTIAGQQALYMQVAAKSGTLHVYLHANGGTLYCAQHLQSPLSPADTQIRNGLTLLRNLGILLSQLRYLQGLCLALRDLQSFLKLFSS